METYDLLTFVRFKTGVSGEVLGSKRNLTVGGRQARLISKTESSGVSLSGRE